MKVRIEIDKDIIVTFGACLCCGRHFGFQICQLDGGTHCMKWACFGDCVGVPCERYGSDGIISDDCDACRLNNPSVESVRCGAREHAKREIEAIVKNEGECVVDTGYDFSLILVDLYESGMYSINWLGQHYVLLRQY